MLVNKHHILFDRAAWQSSDARKDLRNNRWLIPPLSRERHWELHKAVEVVPALDYMTAARVRRTFEPLPQDYPGTVGRLMLSITEAIAHPRASVLQKELGELACYALELQLPFLNQPDAAEITLFSVADVQLNTGRYEGYAA